MSDYLDRFDHALVRQVIPYLDFMQAMARAYQTVTEEQCRRVNNAFDISTVGFDMQCMVNFIERAHESYAQAPCFDQDLFIQAARYADVAHNQTAATVHNVLPPFYHKLGILMEFLVNYIRQLQEANPVLLTDYSNHLNNRDGYKMARHLLCPGDIIDSPQGFKLLVSEVINAEMDQVGVFGHMHGTPEGTVTSEWSPAVSEVMVVGFMPITIKWTRNDGTGLFDSRQEAREASEPGQYPMPKATHQGGAA